PSNLFSSFSFCGGSGGRYGEEKESLLSRSKRSKLWHRSCTCP
ncbi:hypothetical protein E2320_000716, partial [Naja naja]